MKIGKIRVFTILFVSSMASWAVFGSVANAQSPDIYPIYYQVHNVASNDVLNARADSDSGAPIVGSLAHNASPVEIIKQEHNWGYVAVGEQMGWVSMKFLTQIVPPVVGQSQIPVGLSCGGTEPFWGFQLGQTEVNYSHMDDGDATFSIDTAKGFAGFAGRDGFVQAGGTLSLFTGIFTAGQCSDGMSDIDYGWRVNVVLNGTSSTTGFSGCCRLAVSP